MDSLGPPLDALGRYVIDRGYQPGVDSAKGVLNNRWSDAGSRELSQRLADLTEDERAAVIAVSKGAVVSCLHGLLHGISNDTDQVRLLFEGQDVGEISDGLHGDLFAWMSEYSSDPPPAVEIDLDDLDLH